MSSVYSVSIVCGTSGEVTMERHRRSHALSPRIPLPAALLLAASLLASAPVWAADLTPAQKAAEQATLNELNGFVDDQIATTRTTCAMGQAPQWVADNRAKNGNGVPYADASDMCVATLKGIATEGHLGDLYRESVTKLGGSVELSSRIPTAIGAAVLSGATQVAIGNQEAVVVTPALAFDAGFTVAYQQGSAAKMMAANTVKLKAVAQSCLGQHQDDGTCFAAGYIYGARAFNGADD